MAPKLDAENEKLLFTFAIYSAAFKRVAAKLESVDTNDNNLITAKHKAEQVRNDLEDVALGK